MYPGAHAQQDPDRPAVIAAEDGTVLTYRDLDDASMRLAQLLYADGLRPEQHIAFLSTNRLEVFGIYWAGLRSGLFVTAVNHHLSPAEAAYVINDCGAEVLIVSADLADLAVAIADDIPQVRRRLAFGGPVPGYESYSDAVAAILRKRVESDQPEVASTTAYLMAKYGDADDRKILEARLERWRKEWGARQLEADTNQQGRIESELLTGLNRAKDGRIAPERVKELQQSCITKMCKQNFPTPQP